MKTMVMANQKGRVGKTATLVHLAFDFLGRGLRVGVVDLNTQANVSWMLKEFTSGSAARKAAKEVRALADYVFNKMEIA